MLKTLVRKHGRGILRAGSDPCMIGCLECPLTRSVLSYYVLLKDNRKLEPYLFKLSTSNRIYLSKFRCRSNYMPISKEYKHTDTYDTKCKICDKNEIGDEFHYLFICPVFQEDHNRFLKEYYRKFPSMYKFIELMSTTNMKNFKKLAEFATIIIRKFQ